MEENTPPPPRRQLWPFHRMDFFNTKDIYHLVIIGFALGFLTGIIISIFRILKDYAYNHLIFWTSPDHRNLTIIIIWCLIALAASLIVCQLIKNPAIRLGGDPWIKHVLKQDQTNIWRKILLPKFSGILLVLGCGISVGSEGPCIQMGAATALGVQKILPIQKLERHYFILGGCAVGLAGAFSAPFSGVCWVYEVLKQKMTTPFFIFLLASTTGLYICCFNVFHLDIMLPLDISRIPSLTEYCFLFLPLAIFSACIGITYSYLLHSTLDFAKKQKIIPPHFLPLFAFASAAILVFIYPAITGEGLAIFTPIRAGNLTISLICLFLVCKLFYTAFCFGTLIPAGVMVPLICVGGVCGALYAEIMQYWNLMDPALFPFSIAMGMAGAFAASERAPITATVLIAEMTGSWEITVYMLIIAAISEMFARILKAEPV